LHRTNNENKNEKRKMQNEMKKTKNKNENEKTEKRKRKEEKKKITTYKDTIQLLLLLSLVHHGQFPPLFVVFQEVLAPLLYKRINFAD
jgi:hypothetical protein